MKYACWILLLLSSCAIRINDNGYRDLKAKEKAQLQHYKTGLPDSTGYYEITGSEIRQAVANAPYSWVHLWRPYCSGPRCYPLFYYDRIAQGHKQVQFFLVSENYDPWYIERHLKGAAYNHPIYFVMDSAYGHNADRNRKKIIEELLGADMGKGDNHLMFKGDKLIYKGSDMSTGIMDSVLHAH